MRRITRSARLVLTAALAVAPATAMGHRGGDDNGDRTQFIHSATEDTARNAATFPLHRAVDDDGEWARYVVTESSDKRDARHRGVNYAPKLAAAAGTAAVQKGWFDRTGVLHVRDTVDFAPERTVTPGPGGFPPLAATPGAVAQTHYSPLVQLPNGTIINAPHVQNATGMHDKLTAPISGATATFRETEGFYDGREVYYVSFDASQPDVAALEGVSYVPNLNSAPGLGSNDRRNSARSGIAPFANGQTGAANPERQGLNSALLGEGDPLNVVQSRPRQKKYSPLWDVHITVWTAESVAAGRNTRQDDFDTIAELASSGAVTGPAGTWGAVGAVVNCPVISIER